MITLKIEVKEMPRDAKGERPLHLYMRWVGEDETIMETMHAREVQHMVKTFWEEMCKHTGKGWVAEMPSRLMPERKEGDA